MKNELEIAELVERATWVIRARARRAYQRFRSVYEVDDLTHELLLPLLENDAALLRRWDPALGRSFENWVGMLCSRRLRDIARRERGTPWDHAADVESVRSRNASNVEDLYEARQLLELIAHKATRQLSPEAFHVWWRLCVAEEDVREFAKDCSTSESATYALRTRIRARVLSFLAECP